jgi:hypothetical protein
MDPVPALTLSVGPVLAASCLSCDASFAAILR